MITIVQKSIVRYENGELGKNYDFVGDFKNGFARVELNLQFGFINEKGEEIVPVKYLNVWDFCNGFAKVESFKCKMGIINENGEEIVPTKYDNVENFHDGYAKIEHGGEIFYVNEKGEKTVLPFLKT
jgi:hypothetical protein